MVTWKLKKKEIDFLTESLGNRHLFDYAAYASVGILGESSPGCQNNCHGWWNILFVCESIVVYYYIYRVVKARHFYDMNVVKEQSSYIKDKYVANSIVIYSILEFILILVLVKDMQVG